MKTVYIVTDWDDCRAIHIFALRRNAIQYAYECCEYFGARLSIKKWYPPLKMWQYENLDNAIGDNDPIDYLTALTDEDIYDVFYEYYFIAAVEVEDEADE